MRSRASLGPPYGGSFLPGRSGGSAEWITRPLPKQARSESPQVQGRASQGEYCRRRNGAAIFGGKEIERIGMPLSACIVIPQAESGRSRGSQCNGTAC